MTVRRLVPLIAAAVFITLGWATPASAATFDPKVAVLSGWTQASAGSYTGWHTARDDQPAWADYAFDWSTDFCSASPDEPLGFDFRLPCARHDFGYRNYKVVGLFSANKA